MYTTIAHFSKFGLTFSQPRQFFIITLMMLAMLMLFSAGLVEWQLKRYTHQHELKQLTTQQLEFSQEIVQTVLIIQSTQAVTQRLAQQQILKTTLLDWAQHHQTITSMWEQENTQHHLLTPYYLELQHLGHQLLNRLAKEPSTIDIIPFSRQIARLGTTLAEELKILIEQQDKVLLTYLEQIEKIQLLHIILSLGGLLWIGQWFSKKVIATPKRKKENLDAGLITLAQGVALHDNGKFLTVNENLATLFYCRTDELVGKHVLDIIAAKDHQRVKVALALKSFFPCSATGIRRDGSSFPIEITFGQIDCQEQVCALIIIRDVKPGKYIEEKLHENQIRWQTMLSNAPVVIYAKDLQGNYIFSNHHCHHFFPSHIKEVQGKTDDALFPTETAQVLKRHDREVFESQSTRRYEETLMQADGVHTYLADKFPLCNTDGDIYAVCTIALDITQYKHMEEKIRQLNEQLQQRITHVNHALKTETLSRQQTEAAFKISEERYHCLVNTTHEGILMLDAQAQISFINQQLADLLGYTTAEMMGRALIDFIINPLTQDEITDCFCVNKANQQRDICLRHRDGSERWVLINIAPFCVGEGKFEGALAMFTDITERKQTEDILRNVAEGVSMTTGNTFLASLVSYLARTSQVDYAFIGYFSKPHHIKTTHVFAKGQLIDNFEYALTNTPCEAVFQTKTLCSYPKAVQQQFPLDQRLVDRQIDSYAGIPLFDANGVPIGIMVILDCQPFRHPKMVADLLRIFAGRVSAELERRQALEALQTERTSLAKRVDERTLELTHANLELAHVAKLKDEFLASMSHELRTPLNSVLGISEGLQESVYGQLSADQHKAIRHIADSGRHLLSLINDILDLSKIEAGKFELNTNTVITEEVCQASLRMINEITQKKNIRVSFLFDHRVTFIEADERRLKQILVNLLSNAAKFTPPRGCVTLEIKGNQSRQTVDFIVSDTGIGIAPEEIEHLFQPFVQLDSRLARQYEGTGLGLSLVYRLAEMHGGSVSVDSALGQGSCFTVSLPWVQAEAQAIEEDESPQTGQVVPLIPMTSKDKELPLVLLAEDNETNIETLSPYLSAKGYRVAVARDGVETLAQAQKMQPDLILMDIQMPVLDGLQAIRRLRADVQLATVPIIALTALAMPGDRERCLAAGANAYSSKPVNLKELMSSITALMTEQALLLQPQYCA
jgi:PAS domain S-box-containing protein